MALVGRATGAGRGRSGAGGGWLGGQPSPWSSQSVTLATPWWKRGHDRLG